jgi:hypothetical protein
VPGGVGHRHGVGGEAFDATGHQVHDGADLVGRELLPRRLRPQQDGSAGLAGVVGEDVVGRDHEVYVGARDAVDGADGAGQFPLQRPLVVDPLAELRRRDALLVEEGVTLRTAGGEALGAHVEAQLVHLRLGHEHGGAAVGQLVLHTLAGELLGDGGGVGRAEIAVERCPGRLGGPLGEEPTAEHDGGDGQAQHGLLARGEPRPHGGGAAAGDGDVESHRLRPPCS